MALTLKILAAGLGGVVLGAGRAGWRTRRRDSLRVVILVLLATAAVLLPASTVAAQQPPRVAATPPSGDLNGACPPELGGLFFSSYEENKVQPSGGLSYKYMFECAYWNAPEVPLKKHMF